MAAFVDLHQHLCVLAGTSVPLASWSSCSTPSAEGESRDSHDRRVPVAQSNKTYLGSVEKNKIAATNDSN